MKSKKERLEKLTEEDFYFIFFDGTRMPSNPRYVEITMFNDTIYIENEKGENENYNDIYFIIRVKNMIEDNLENIEKMLIAKGSSIKSSFNHEFTLKINNKIYKINRNVCNEEGKKLFDAFTAKLYEILATRKSSNNNTALINEINNWKQNNNTENFKKMIEQIRSYVFYCPMKGKEIAIIRNSRGERLLTAFSNMIELHKWIKKDETEIKKINLTQYSNIILSENYGIDGLVIDPFGVNLILDKKIIKGISQLK